MGEASAMRLFVVALCVAACVVTAESATLTDSSGMGLMESLGLRSTQESVDKAVWSARQAKEVENAEDEEIARLMAKLTGLDKEKKAAEAEATQKDIEAKKATAAKLKEVADQKAAKAKEAIDAKAKKVEAAALAAQKTAEDTIAATKALRAKAAAAMEKAKAASAEYQNALSSGTTKGLEELAMKAKKTMAEAQALAAQAGTKSDEAKGALKNAARVKTTADKAVAMEKESKAQLTSEGVTWVAGPIFDKMKRLCDQDYPTFRKEYRKIRDSPTYKHYRWDIKKACKKAHNDDLENMSDAEVAAEQKRKEAEEAKKIDSPPIDPSKPYPDSHTHFSLPANKKVKKWCTTKYGAVPCSMLKKAQAAGLLGTAKDNDEFLQDAEGLDTVDPLED